MDEQDEQAEELSWDEAIAGAGELARITGMNQHVYYGTDNFYHVTARQLTGEWPVMDWHTVTPRGRVELHETTMERHSDAPGYKRVTRTTTIRRGDPPPWQVTYKLGGCHYALGTETRDEAEERAADIARQCHIAVFVRDASGPRVRFGKTGKGTLIPANTIA